MATIIITGIGAPHSFAVGSTVNLEATPSPNFSGNSYQWSFLDKPLGSLATFSDDTAQITSFNVDVEGTYFVRVVVDDLDVGENAAACPYNTINGPLRVPAAGETFEVDPIKGWAPAVQDLYRLAIAAYNLAQLNNLIKSWKDPVRVASTVNVSLAGVSPLIIDTIPLNDGDRVLLKTQAAGEENGIYVLEDDSVNYLLVRADDANSSEKLYGAIVNTLEGAANEDLAYMQIVDSIVLETTPLVWVLFGQTASTVNVPSGNADLVNDAGVRKLRWIDGGNTYEVELSLV